VRGFLAESTRSESEITIASSGVEVGAGGDGDGGGADGGEVAGSERAFGSGMVILIWVQSSSGGMMCAGRAEGNLGSL
jgi:hypothetical protein